MGNYLFQIPSGFIAELKNMEEVQQHINYYTEHGYIVDCLESTKDSNDVITSGMWEAKKN